MRTRDSGPIRRFPLRASCPPTTFRGRAEVVEGRAKPGQDGREGVRDSPTKGAHHGGAPSLSYFETEAFQKYGHGAGSTPVTLGACAESALKSPILMAGTSA